jgi:hypothetical protein
MPKEIVAFFLGTPGFREWFVRKTGADSFLSRKAPSVYIVNDGGYSGHGYPEVSEKFMLDATTAGAPAKLALRAQTTLRHLGGWDELIGWATRQRLTSEPKGTFVRAQKNTVQDVLTEKFLVVPGTNGTEQQNAMNELIADKIKDAWAETHFAPCQIVKDRDISSGQLRDANLVLIGNDKTNMIWDRLCDGTNLKITESDISLNEHRWLGGSIVIQAAVENPKNKAKRLVFVGGNQPIPDAFGTLNLSRDGWFSYAIWAHGSGGTSLVEAR